MFSFNLYLATVCTHRSVSSPLGKLAAPSLDLALSLTSTLYVLNIAFCPSLGLPVICVLIFFVSPVWFSLYYYSQSVDNCLRMAMMASGPEMMKILSYASV